jgi:hypothetical protein
MRFCCRAFEYWHNAAGERGFGVFVAHDASPEPLFVIQHRALDSNGSPPALAPTPLSLVSDLIIKFCPWCGLKLEDFYLETARNIDRTDLKVI